MTTHDSQVQTHLEVQDLHVHFKTKSPWWQKSKKYIRAVQGVSFQLKKGQTLGVVGESGCGKSTLSRAILQLQEITKGKILLSGQEVHFSKREEELHFRRKIQVVFQDPFASLNPRMTVGELLTEPILCHRIVNTKTEAENSAIFFLEKVGLSAEALNKFPHEFSGGQRQRIVIARALSLKPELLICDEPVSALDVSIQSQILNLLKDLQKNLGLTLILISHDLKVVEYLADQIAVMYLGQFVEYGNAEAVIQNPRHPYTKTLLSAVPNVQRFGRPDRILLKGDVPNSTTPIEGCSFHPRCPWAQDICKTNTPQLLTTDASLSAKSCHFEIS